MISKWVEYDESLCFAENEAKMEILMSAIRAIRNRRAEMNIHPSKKAKVYVETEKTELFSAGCYIMIVHVTGCTVIRHCLRRSKCKVCVV